MKEYMERKSVIEKFDLETKSIKETTEMITKSNIVSMQQAFSVLKEFNIQMCKTEFVSNEKEFDTIIEKFVFPIAMKASSGIPHKTDLGLVRWNIDKENAKKEFLKMQEVLSKMKKPLQIAVQEMVVGEEVIVSSITNDFGKIITFGLGGIFVEIMKDISQKIAPINDADIEDMFNEVRGFAVLKGARTKKKYNVDSLKKIIKSVAILAQTYPELKEIEMNPIIVNENGAYAIDAIMIK